MHDNRSNHEPRPMEDVQAAHDQIVASLELPDVFVLTDRARHDAEVILSGLGWVLGHECGRPVTALLAALADAAAHAGLRLRKGQPLPPADPRIRRG